MKPWPLERIDLLRAVTDRIIPRDRDPSATDLGVDRYILHQMQSGAVPEEDRILAGIAALAQTVRDRSGGMFRDLPPGEQDGLLRDIAMEPWFQTLAELAAEGYYADPGNGGNADARAWTMIGYGHRLPEGPSGPSAAEPPPATARSRTGDAPDDMEARRPAETIEKGQE
jgi:hypothetical protein